MGYLEFVVYNVRRSTSSFSFFNHQITLILFMGFFGVFFFFLEFPSYVFCPFSYILSALVFDLGEDINRHITAC